MKKNMGTADKAIRLLVVVVIAILFITKVLTGTLAIILLVLAAIFLLTSFISFCPLYLPFGINTDKKKEYHHFKRFKGALIFLLNLRALSFLLI